jgi:hypothetical protein
MTPEQKADTFAEIIKGYVDKATADLKRSVDILQDRLSALATPVNGVDGKDGRDGVDGKNGQDGKSVSAEEINNLIVAAVSKVMAGIKKPKDGDDGRDGKDGRDGRDAGDIEFLPSINPEKSYSKGTYASHDGGLWKAKRTTQGMDGWDCLVAGVKSFDVVKIGERTYQSILEKSDGQKQTFEFQIPGMIYRGVYREQQYEPGDTVTWGGSLWHCDKSTKEKPGCNDSWTLSAKRGADARPIVKVEDKK